MGLFSGQVEKLGTKLSSKLRKKADGYHERAASAIGENKPGMASRLEAIGETLEAVAEAIEDAITSDTGAED